MSPDERLVEMFAAWIEDVDSIPYPVITVQEGQTS